MSRHRSRRTSFALAAALIACVMLPARAVPEQLSLNNGIWCDRVEQIEYLYRLHYGREIPLADALRMTNAAARDPNACVSVQAIVMEGGETRRIVAGTQMLSIVEYAVFGIVQNGRPVRIPPQTWYAAKVLSKGNWL